MKKKIWLGILFFTLIWPGIFFTTAEAQDKKVAAFYKGTFIRFIVPYGPGGGYDQWARALAPVLQKYTGAKVIVENMVGAGGFLGSSYMYTAAKPDGLTIGILPMSAMVVAKMLNFENAKFELDKFNYVGRVESSARGVFASKASGFKSIADMQKATKTFNISGTDPMSDSNVDGTLFIEAFGLNAKQLSGSGGTSQTMLFLIAGRGVDLGMGNIPDRIEFARKGQITFIAPTGKKRLPEYPDIPTALETPGIKPGGKKYLELMADLSEIGRVIVLPPGVPEERRLFLERALTASLKEQAVLNWAKSRGITVLSLPGKECKDLIIKMTNLVPQSERANLKHIMLEKYY